jgi:hypothetical protein
LDGVHPGAVNSKNSARRFLLIQDSTKAKVKISHDRQEQPKTSSPVLLENQRRSPRCCQIDVQYRLILYQSLKCSASVSIIVVEAGKKAGVMFSLAGRLQ